MTECAFLCALIVRGIAEFALPFDTWRAVDVLLLFDWSSMFIVARLAFVIIASTSYVSTHVSIVPFSAIYSLAAPPHGLPYSHRFSTNVTLKVATWGRELSQLVGTNP